MNNIKKELLYVGIGIIGFSGLITGLDKLKMHPTMPEFGVVVINEEYITPQLDIRVKKSVIPTYPKNALAKGIEGKVLVAAEIDSLGNVVQTSISSTSNNEDLDYSALNAAGCYKFEFQKGFEYKGLVHVTIPFEYKLN